MPKKKRSKTRASFRKNHQGRVRNADLTRHFRQGDRDKLDDVIQTERVSGKGELTRKRTVRDSSADDSAAQDALQDPVSTTATTEHSERPDGSTKRGGRQSKSPATAGRDVDGRVLSVHGLNSRVLGSDGRTYECTIRQVLKSLFTDARHAVVAGDRVRIRPESDRRGTIESVQLRHGVINRTSRGRQHIIAANVDYLMVITSAAEPGMKPALVDRYLLTAEQCRVKPIVVINKADLVDPIDLQQAMGVYAAIGYRVVMTSAQSGMNIQYLKALLAGKQTVLSGQSGVGKSSLLNAIEPGLGLAVATVSKENDKGRHTTTASRLIPIGPQGAVFDTPGIRQFQLWDIDSGEVAGLMPDLRPFVSHCRYPNCLHLSEDGCAVKNAVADAQIDARRYDAYCHLVEDELLPAESSRH